MTAIALIVGLGNPGNQYTATRHNVGFWFIARLQRKFQINFALEKKFRAETGRFDYNGNNVRIVVPNTFMNLSGESVAPLASFYRISPPQILVVHDELDLPPGSVRLKIGGGHGGHNGLRDIVSKLGSSEFVRLRIGIGHPNADKDVSGFVLTKPMLSEQNLIEDAIDRSIEVLPQIINGKIQTVMTQLHTETSKIEKNGD